MSAPPEIYLKRRIKPGEFVRPHPVIKITGKVKDHLRYYAWKREMGWKTDGCISYPETTYRLLARPSSSPNGTYIVTSVVTHRILGLVLTEDGSIYTLGIELGEKDPLLTFAKVTS